MSTNEATSKSKLPLAVLQSIWGFNTFRGQQQNIIEAALAGQHTFVSMPTGGGKSLCYQVPVLCQEGIGIVISPLVALMKDQIANLKKVGIKATDLSSGLSPAEITERLDNCIHGNYQFLYLSPERLSSDRIREQLRHLKVSLLIIDEAHCISQWGHDFRPAYLKVKSLIELFPETPVMSLTATATSEVKKDILDTLGLPEVVSFNQSFERKNIGYSIFNVEDKLHYVKKILTKNTGPSIVYVRTRKGTLDWANHLNQLGFKSTAYHGRMYTKDKQKNMSDWVNEEVQVMVATNAFGMGIDKSNVQSVIHIDLPENIENYYQESGRAGRNGKPAHAVILYQKKDIERIQYQTLNNLSDKDFLLHFYKKMCSYLNIAYGEGLDQSFSLALELFCKKYDFSLTKAYNCLLFLDRQNCIALNPNFSNQTTVQITLSPQEVIQFVDSHKNKGADILLHIIRNHSGVYEIPTPIHTQSICEKTGVNNTQLQKELQLLQNKNIIQYQGETTNVLFTMTEMREDDYTINRVAKDLKQYNTLKKEKLSAITSFIENATTCLNKQLLAYFGEVKKEGCGICSVCIKNSNDTAPISKRITGLLINESLSSKDISLVLQADENLIITSLQELLESNTIAIHPNNKYYLL